MSPKASRLRSWLAVPAASVVFIGAVAVLGLEQSQLKSVDLFVCWEPQAQFAGYYVANELGMFRDAGLKVSIRHDLGVGESLTEVVKRDDAFLATLFPNVLAWVANNPKVDVIGVITSGCNLGWATNAPLSELPQILEQGQLQSWWGPQDLMLRSFLKSRGHAADDLATRVSASVSPDLSKGRTAVLAMRYNELLDSARFLGQNTEFSTYCDMGFPMFEDALMGRVATGPQDRALQRRVAEAIWKGWDYALRNPERALEIVMKQRPRKPRSHQERQLATFLSSLTPKGATPADYAKTLETMRTMVRSHVFPDPKPIEELVSRLEGAKTLRLVTREEAP